VQFTVGQEAHDKLRRVQAVLRREIPKGDPGLIFEQALDLLMAKVEKEKLGAATTARPRPVVRRVTDKKSRHIPADVKRAVWLRDRGQCAFVAVTGMRCTERTFLELHHIQPYALKGAATVVNIALRCRRHNQYEAELVFPVSRPLTETSP
jgi:5-methylcytosine-specific restriction endonuclease McrA